MERVHLIAATVGFFSMFLLWLSVLAGLTLSRGWMMTRIRHSTMLAVHHTLALLGLCLGVVHGLAQLASPSQTVKVVDTFIPFTNEWDPIGIGVGVIALELMIALAISSTIQRMFGFHRWRALHALSYASYTLLTGHVLVSGSETGSWAVTLAVLVPWLLVIWLWLAGTGRPGGSSPADKLAPKLAANVTTIEVDPVSCARFGFCEQEAPDVFNLRGDGQLAYHTVVPEQYLEAATRAARVCPARAIKLSQSGAGLNLMDIRTGAGGETGDRARAGAGRNGAGRTNGNAVRNASGRGRS